jgi:hypothetical protein
MLGRRMTCIVRLVLATATAGLCAAGALGQAPAQAFHPIRELTTWYTDRALVDIEIVGSTSRVPEFHRLEPDRVLRFRLERAHINKLIADEGPAYEIVGFAFDIETGQPEALLDAVANRGRFHEDIAGIPVVAPGQRVKRTLQMTISSDSSAAALVTASDFNRQCAGATLGDQLRAYQSTNRRLCVRPSYPRASLYVADYDEGLALRVQCQEATFPGRGCHVSFPFEGFAVDLSFHRDHLGKRPLTAALPFG